MTLDKGLDWDSLMPKDTPYNPIEIDQVTAVIREPIVSSPQKLYKAEQDQKSQLKEPSVQKSVSSKSKYEIPKDTELELNFSMKPDDNPESEINLLQSQGTDVKKSSDMKQKMREKGFDIESLLGAETPSKPFSSIQPPMMIPPVESPEPVDLENDYQKALDDMNREDYQDQSMTGLKEKFAGFKDRLNNHLEDNQNLDLANYQEESPLPESLAKLKSSPDL